MYEQNIPKFLINNSTSHHRAHQKTLPLNSPIAKKFIYPFFTTVFVARESLKISILFHIPWKAKKKNLSLKLFSSSRITIKKCVWYKMKFLVYNTTTTEKKEKKWKEFAMWMTDLLKQNIFMCLYAKRGEEKRAFASIFRVYVWYGEDDEEEKRNLLHAAERNDLHAPIVWCQQTLKKASI